ncbi:hypothetical protein ACFQNE_01970 [Gordonia phosphorivorans]|uniref:HNH endonuclease n=1 Tax=Gordonia phosphorivorans TaxID=1056982 RepID=A0ABV6H976_9ACTN
MLLNVAELPEFDDRLMNETFGFLVRCATQAAAHLTDYVVTRGTAIQVAGITRIDALLASSIFAGLMTEVVLDDGGYAYKIIDTDAEFIHLRLKTEVEWERQQREDSNRPSLTVPVRIRDGDACRWCGNIVNWNNDRRSGRAGTYDHLIPGEAARIDTFVVCCKTCNSSRKRNEFPKGITEIMPPPEEPLYSVYTVRWLTENRWRQDNGYQVPVATAPEALDKIARSVTPRRQSTDSRHPAASGDLPGQAAAESAPPVSGNAAAGATQESASRYPAASGDLPGQAAAESAPPVSGNAAAGATQENTESAAEGATPTGQAAVGASRSDHVDRTGGPAASAAAPPAERPPPPVTPAPIASPAPINRRSSRNQPDPADRQGTESVRPGRGGSGRAGPGRVGSPDHSPPRPNSHRRRRGRRGRGGGTQPH